MATRDELRALAQLRLREAEALFAADLYDGCVYLCGYVVELGLKAVICATLGVDEYPDESFFWTHDFDRLRLLAGLQKDIAFGRPALFRNWSFATQWDPKWRYQAEGTYGRADAEIVLEAITSKPDGVLSFLATRW